MSKLLIIFFLIGITYSLSAQMNEDYDYQIDQNWGLIKSTNGGILSGGFYRLGIKQTENRFRLIGVELVNIKHRKEQRYTTNYGNAVVIGKANYLYTLRAQYGYSFILFKKAPQQGTQVSLVTLAGPSFGFVTPYYVLIDKGGGYVSEQYDASQNYDANVVRADGFLKGIGETDLRMGVHAKIGLQFEFGTSKSNVSAKVSSTPRP